MKIFFICLYLLLISPFSVIQVLSNDTLKRITPQEYVAMYSHIAVKHMKEHGIPASITLAQGILESGSGNSDLARNANNHFGIKCHRGWEGESYLKDDDSKNECFRKYKNAEESFKDHAVFLTTRSRYASLFELSSTDYKGWAHGLKAAGYATNPEYAERLIGVIERYELHTYDTGKPKKPIFKHGNERQVKDHPRRPEEQRVDISLSNRTISRHNGIKYTVAQSGDNLQQIADDLEIRPWMIRKYNDLTKDAEIKPGERIYIQSKKRRGSEDFHTVTEDDTLHSVSQKYGIRLQRLIRLNAMDENTTLTPGLRLRLR